MFDEVIIWPHLPASLLGDLPAAPIAKESASATVESFRVRFRFRAIGTQSELAFFCRTDIGYEAELDLLRAGFRVRSGQHDV